MTITTHRPHKSLLTLAIATITLTACGGSGSSSQPDVEPEPPKALGTHSLKKAGSTQAFLAYYQQGLNNAYTTYKTDTTVPEMSDTPTANPTTADGESGGADFGVSNTNLIEHGVDEADYAKQNATHLFTAHQAENSHYINAYLKPNTTKVGSIEQKEISSINGFYLTDTRVITIANTPYPADYWENPNRFSLGKIKIDSINITDPANMQVAETYNLEGNVQTSRRIGNNLYVVSSARLNDPWGCMTINDGSILPANNSATVEPAIIPPCEPQPLTEELIIERMPTDINGNKIKPSDCFIPNEYSKDNNRINSNITLVTKVDLTDSKAHETTCIAASAPHVYMNTKAIYLTGYAGNNTSAINKFSVNQGTTTSPSEPTISYSGSANVDGHINWNTQSFSLNEHKDVLRVVTSKWGENGTLKNMLHTLKESDEKQELIKLATLPNAEQPQPIGKPNERIQGIRFLGDEGYVVTFLQTDPLYKIDLADPAQPKILGELEMTGFSTYLQRINDNYLLGVGYSANENGRITGVQTTVFDTSGDAPKIVSQDTIEKLENGWINLPLRNDSRAIMTLKNNSTMRIALPYRLFGYVNDKYTSYQEAVEYEVNLASGSLTRKAKRNFATKLSFYSSKKRALLDGNDIYYNQDNGGITKYVWAQPQ